MFYYKLFLYIFSVRILVYFLVIYITKKLYINCKIFVIEGFWILQRLSALGNRFINETTEF